MSITTVIHKKISNFELRELIGAGGMANIYKGLQLSLERPVAIKILHQHLTLNEDFVTRFKQEAKQAAILQHQNIVSIIDYGHQDAEYFIAMEFIDGQNLKEILTRIKRFPLEVCMLIIREVANGLKYAHSQGLIHRDIKPANIMLSQDGRVVITDFGIAKSHSDMSITVTGQTVGSPAYMSPEQAAGRPIDNRCDMFSLGIVFYEMVTGEKPFKGETFQEAMTNIISAVPPDPSSIRIDVTPSIESIMKKLLEKDIESRYQDAEDLVGQLDSELAHYLIPSEKKLVAEFVKNPVRIAQKLRTDRISKHMESALYYVNIGHGRLSDAIKEFENVLRYDKNNKLAKQYLDKLKTGQEGFAGTRKFRKLGKLTRWLAVSAILVILMSSILLVRHFKNQGQPDAVESQLPADNAIQQLAAQANDNDMEADIAKTEMPPQEEVKKPPPQSAGLKAEQKASARNSKPVSKPSTQPNNVSPKATSEESSKFNYPNQDLARYGLLQVVSDPPARFLIDFREYGLTGGPPVKLSPGRHFVVIEAKGYRTERKRIYTEEDKLETFEISLHKGF
jgi:serine/threonine protein kinase